MFNWLSGVRPGSRMPLSQAISDTDCIMRARNQLTAAGSYGESMILNRNQDKLNLTLSLASPSCHSNLNSGRSWQVLLRPVPLSGLLHV